MTEEEHLEFMNYEFDRLDVRPSDVITMKLDRSLSQADYAKIQKKLVAALKDRTKAVKIIILDPRIELMHQEF